MPEDLTAAVRDHATRSWNLFTRDKKLQARIPDWRTTTSPDGNTVLSVEVAGPGAAHALRLFATHCHVTLTEPGDLRPQFDVDVPDRTVLVWRHCGVWVQLWHPDTVTDLPHTPVPSAPPVRPVKPKTFLSRASARLPSTRRPKTTKETTTS